MTTLVDSARNAVAPSGGQFDSRYPQAQAACIFSATIPPGRIYPKKIIMAMNKDLTTKTFI